MPIYEYKCGDCGATFGMLQPVTASRAGAQCPNCGSSKTERVASRFSPAKGKSSCPSDSPFT